MKQLTALLAALLLTGLAIQAAARADSVVVLGNDLRYGVCHSNTLAKSRSCAMSNCFKFSGIPVTCKVVYHSAEQGYYALAMGQVSWGVGNSPRSQEDADAIALAYCQQAGPCEIAATWEEKLKK